MAAVHDDIKVEDVELSDSDDEGQQTKKKEGRGYKMKKFWASKTAATKIGRGIILHFLGDSANKLLDALKSMAQKDKGKKQADKMIKLVLKMALKGKLMWDQGFITPAHTNSMVNPVNDMVTKLYEGLEYQGEMPAHLIQLVAAKFTALEDLLEGIIGSHMQPKNLAKLKEVINYFGGVPLLTKLFNDQKFKAERDTIEKAVGELVAPLLEEERERRKRCSDNTCENPHLHAQAGFRGTPLCAMHHEEVYKRFTAKPEAMHFVVESGKTYKPWKALAANKLNGAQVAFLAAVYNFGRSSVNVRRLFAEALVDKYLLKSGENYVEGVDASVVEGLQADLIKLRDAGEKPSPDFFDPVKKEVLREVEVMFESWKDSKDYKQYLGLIELPKNLKKEAAEQRVRWEKVQASM